MPTSCSARLKLPLLLPSQAQKHVTVNEALTQIDHTVQLVIEERGVPVPPGTPAEGQVWEVGPGATGDWSGQTGRLAARAGGGWVFVDPGAGWRAYDRTDARMILHDGTGWQPLASGLDLDNLASLGIGTAANPVNRLAVAAPATLLTHAGSDHRVTVNKAAPGDTASLLFQTGFSGRAEFGLAGSDAFSIKVSADGSTWTQALNVPAATGVPALTSGATVGGKTIYSRGNAIGTVGQSGGVPTGAVVERGANANGSYTRWADGTQICWADGMFNASLGANAYTETSWTFPATFVSGSVPTVRATARSLNDAPSRQSAARYIRVVGTPSGASSGDVGVVNLHTSALFVRADVMALGRWF